MTDINDQLSCLTVRQASYCQTLWVVRCPPASSYFSVCVLVLAAAIILHLLSTSSRRMHVLCDPTQSNSLLETLSISEVQQLFLSYVREVVVQCNVNVNMKVKLHEQVRYSATLHYYQLQRVTQLDSAECRAVKLG